MRKKWKKCCTALAACSLMLILPGMTVFAKEAVEFRVVSTFLRLDYMSGIFGSKEVYITKVQGYPAQFQLTADVRTNEGEKVVFQVYNENEKKTDAVWYPAREVAYKWLYVLDLSGSKAKGTYSVAAYIERRNGSKVKINESKFEVGEHLADGTEELDGQIDTTKDEAVAASASIPEAKEVIAPGQYPIMGKAFVSADELAKFYETQGNAYPDGILSAGGADDIQTFCQIYYEEAVKEGVKPEVAFMQAMLETGWLQYGGDATASQYNFAGLGTTGGGVRGNSFPDVRTGIRAQIQHLKAYATSEPLNQDCVDERYQYVAKGCAPYVELLGQKENPQGTGWATAERYGYLIVELIQKLRQ